jgi:hypothetical protein
MPPLGLFAQNDRPHGWEFASCGRCNQGTRGADAVAQFMAKIEAITEENWKVRSISQLYGSLRVHAPGVLEEIFGQTAWSDRLVRRNGLLFKSKSARINGPLTKRYLDLFSAKAAMASFREFTGRPIEMQSLIYTEWFLNGGMSREIYQNMTSILPSFTQLKQGRKESGKQFSLRYNTNEKDVVAALLSFHSSLHIMVIATDNPELIDGLSHTISKIQREHRPSINLTKAGLPELDEGA